VSLDIGAIIDRRYLLKREIARGGAGAVFEAERQALALMDHPHVAKVLDAGATDTGRPYFVMEFVEGDPITEYCDRGELSLRDRLDLFIQVCGAVQHAHQKGIIHRDIKPSNVLVAELDGKPVPKVIDFGIAKATEQKLTERTMFTEFGAFMGTPAYMSPEQAEGQGVDVDTRSDIYSLGVLLYELLTGSTPFDVKTLRSAAISEIQRIIREEEPNRPSTRLTTLGDSLSEVAKLRRLDVRRIRSALRGDLDWIVMKALDKDRQRRYDTATDFSRDLERYLNHEPVTAGPPSVAYRLKKFVRRNRSGVAVGAVAALALVGFAVTMAVQAQRIAAERDRANHEREMSDRVVAFQASMLQGIDPLKLGESIASDLRSRIDVAMSEKVEADEQRQATIASFDTIAGQINLTDTARTVLDANILTPATQAIEKQFAQQPQVEGRLQYALARTYAVLGLPDKALARSERALELQRGELGDDHRDTLRTLVAKAMILFDLNRYAECSAILRKTIASAQREFGPDDSDTLRARLCLAISDAEHLPKDDSRKVYEGLLKDQERVLGPDHDDVASTLQNLGVVLLNQHHNDEAAPILERALAIYHKQGEPDDYGALSTMQKLSQVYQSLGRMDEATKLQLDATQRLEKVRGGRHPNTIQAVNNLADLYKDQGRYQEAEPFARKAVELSRAVNGDSHRTTLKGMTTLGIILGLLGRHDEAGPFFIEAYERSKAAFGADNKDTLDDLNNLAVYYWFLGQYQKAFELFAENLSALERIHGKDHVETTGALANLALLHIKLGRLDEAKALLDRALAVRIKAYGPDHPKTLEVRAFVARLAYEEKDWERAEHLFAELVAAQKNIHGPDHSYTLESMYNRAVAMEMLGRKDEAEKMMAAVFEGRRRAVGEHHSETLDAASELARLQLEAGRADEARTLFVETIAARRAAATPSDASPAQLNACAVVLLNCPIKELCDPKQALAFAERANEATGHADAAFLNTLARALFDNGERNSAIETQRKAIALLSQESPLRADYEERLAKYSDEDPSQ